MRWLYDTGDANAFPSSPYTITVLGFETPVVFEMDGYDKPTSITAYDQTMPITENAWLYGNYTFDLFEVKLKNSADGSKPSALFVLSVLVFLLQ